MFVRKIYVFAFFLFLSAVSLNAYSSVSQVEISDDQKNVMLYSNVSDDARVGQHSPYQISYIEIIPSYVSVPAGFSTHVYIQCYDAFRQPVSRFWLRYWVVDFYGRYVQNVIWLNHLGVLQVSSFAPRGPYRIYFQDANGPASAMMDVNVY